MTEIREKSGNFMRVKCIVEPWEKIQGKMTEIREKSGNFMRGKKWESCLYFASGIFTYDFNFQ